MVTLKPGDLFFLGTNHQGIGPLQDGEHAVIEIDRIGRLEFNVSDPLKRRDVPDGIAPGPFTVLARFGDRWVLTNAPVLAPG